MADDKTPPKPKSMLERLREEEAREAELQQQELAREAKEARITQTIKTVYDDVVATFTAEAGKYASSHSRKTLVDEIAKEAKPKAVSPKQALLTITRDMLKEKPQYATGSMEIAILDALTLGKISTKTEITDDISFARDYIGDDTNTYSRANFINALKVIPLTAVPTKPGSGKPLTSPTIIVDDPIPPVTTADDRLPPAPTGAWGEDDTVPPPTRTTAPTGFPAFRTDGGGGIKFPDPRSNAEIETAVKELNADCKKILEVTTAALDDKYANEYANLGSTKNKAFLKQLQSAAQAVTKEIAITATTAGYKRGDSKNTITVSDADKEMWADMVDAQNRLLDAALIKSEAAQFALTKTRTPMSAKAKLADAMRKTITEECTMAAGGTPAKEGLDPLDDALAPPTVMQKHGGKIKTAAVVAVLGILSAFGVSRMMKNGNVDKPDNKPDPALVVKADPVEIPEAKIDPVIPKKEEPKEVPKEVPKDAGPKIELPKEVLPPPKAGDMPKVDVPKVVAPEDNPVGKKTADLKAIFEKNIINDFVLANPDVIKRGFITEKEGIFKVADNITMSYLPLDDVNRGIYVMHNKGTGKTMIEPPANKRLEIGLVPNFNQKKMATSYHISQIKGGKETVLKDQLGEEINFTFPEPVQPNKFMTGEVVLNNGTPIIEVAAYYPGGRDELKGSQRIDGEACPIIRPGFRISGLPIGTHSGVAIDYRGAKLDPLVPTSRSGGGAGSHSDSYVIAFQQKQECLVLHDPAVQTYDLGKAPIVPGAKGGFDTPNLKFTGIAVPMRHRVSLPSGDKRPAPYRDLVSNLEGGGILYILPSKEATIRVAQGNEPPISYTEGAPVPNKQIERIQTFIKDTKDLLYPQEDKVFTFKDYATQSIRSQWELSTIKYARLEAPRGHSMAMPKLEPGAFGAAGGPLIGPVGLREKNTATRYTNNSLTAKPLEEGDRKDDKEKHSWLDAHERAAKDLKDRAESPVEMGKTKRAAAEKFKAAELLIRDIAKIKDDDAEKTKKLNELYDLEAEAARLLGVTYPDPLKDGAEDKEKADHAKKVAAARTLMRALLLKTPAAILQNRIEAELEKEKDPRAPLFKTTDEDIDMDMGALPMDRFRAKLHDRELALSEHEIGTVARPIQRR